MAPRATRSLQLLSEMPTLDHPEIHKSDVISKLFFQINGYTGDKWLTSYSFNTDVSVFKEYINQLPPVF